MVPISSLPFTIDTPGSYFLEKDLSSNQHGIEIASSDVVVDFKGRCISGCGNSHGIIIKHVQDPSGKKASPKNVLIKDGTVKNFDRGIHLDESVGVRGLKVSNIDLEQNKSKGLAYHLFYHF